VHELERPLEAEVAAARRAQRAEGGGAQAGGGGAGAGGVGNRQPSAVTVLTKSNQSPPTS